jgi:hypothetical protein
MAITSAFCNQAKIDFLAGVHQPGDVYKIALYTSAASLDKTTTVYSATNEVANGNGYTTGGATLAGYASALSGDTGYISFSNATWAAASITARGALIYNSSRSNKAIAVLNFGSDITSTNGTFTVTMPAAGASAIIEIA